MILTGIQRHEDRTLVFFQRHLYRTPVWGNGLVFGIDRTGVIRSVSGTMHTELGKQLFHRPKSPAFSAAKAAARAREWLDSVSPSAEIGEIRSCYLPDHPGVPLVYALQLDPEGYVLIHAMTGRIIRSNI